MVPLWRAVRDRLAGWRLAARLARTRTRLARITAYLARAAAGLARGPGLWRRSRERRAGPRGTRKRAAFLAWVGGRAGRSATVAARRLRMVVAYDRAAMAPVLLESLKADLLAVASRYVDVGEPGLQVELGSRRGAVNLVVTVPVRRLERSRP